MEIDNTDCPVFIDHEVAGSPVSRGACAFSEERGLVCLEQGVFTRSCMKEANITLATCPAERLFRNC